MRALTCNKNDRPRLDLKVRKTMAQDLKEKTRAPKAIVVHAVWVQVIFMY